MDGRGLVLSEGSDRRDLSPRNRPPSPREFTLDLDDGRLGLRPTSTRRPLTVLCTEVKESLQHLVLVPDLGSRVAYWLTVWEIFVSALTLFCAYLIPFSLALPTVAVAAQRMFNNCTDTVFTLDLLRVFFLAYRNTAESNSDTLWEKDIGKIARRYLTLPMEATSDGGWFWLDAALVVPSWFRPFARTRTQALILQQLRVLRLTRIMRLARLGRKIQEWQTTTGVPFFISDIVKFVFITTFVSHCAACVWVMIERKVSDYHFVDEDSPSWLSALRSAKGDCCSPDAERDPLCVYTLALYWAMMTLTSVGYGDITPQNQLEYSLCTLLMLISGFVWAYIVGSVCSVLAQIDPENARFKQTTDALNQVMEQWNVPAGLRSKLREYRVVAKTASSHHRQQQCMEQTVSRGLQQKVVLETPVMGTIKEKVYWARDLDTDALLEIIRSLKNYIYGKEENIPMRKKMILVRMGLVAVGGRILGRNEVCGQNSILLVTDMLLTGPMPRTLTYTSVLSLEQADLIKVCEQYASADRRIRVAQIRTAVWRGFVLAAVKEQKRKRMSVHFEQMRRTRGFVEANTPGNLDDAMTATGLKEVENMLEEGHQEFESQLAETRELVQGQMDRMMTISHQITERNERMTQRVSMAPAVASQAMSLMARVVSRASSSETSAPASASRPPRATNESVNSNYSQQSRAFRSSIWTEGEFAD